MGVDVHQVNLVESAIASLSVIILERVNANLKILCAPCGDRHQRVLTLHKLLLMFLGGRVEYSGE